MEEITEILRTIANGSSDYPTNSDNLVVNYQPWWFILIIRLT